MNKWPGKKLKAEVLCDVAAVSIERKTMMPHGGGGGVTPLVQSVGSGAALCDLTFLLVTSGKLLR